MARRRDGCAWPAPQPIRPTCSATGGPSPAPRARGRVPRSRGDETGGGRFAVLAMTHNPRVRIAAGSLILVRVGTKEPRPLTETATHFHEPPYAIAGWIET